MSISSSSSSSSCSANSCWCACTAECSSTPSRNAATSSHRGDNSNAPRLMATPTHTLHRETERERERGRRTTHKHTLSQQGLGFAPWWGPILGLHPPIRSIHWSRSRIMATIWEGIPKPGGNKNCRRGWVTWAGQGLVKASSCLFHCLCPTAGKE